MINKELQDGLQEIIQKLKEYPDDRRVRIYVANRTDDGFEQLMWYRAVFGKMVMSDDIDISIS